MVRARKYVVKNHFKGLPKPEDYEIVEYELPPLQHEEILIKTEWISVDPYHRVYNVYYQVPYDQFGFQVGTVLESKNPKFPVGTKVVTHKGWCDYAIAKEGFACGPLNHVYELPNLEGLSPSVALGAMGMSGISAYIGLIEISKPKPGETVVVTTAAGSVGSVAGQMAKIIGCKVIGFTGSDDKVQCLDNELGFDRAFNYKKVDIVSVLKDAAPNGVDCYFDNVGGEISSIIMSQMNKFGRVTVCGSISAYNDGATELQLPKVTMVQPSILFHQLKLEGFLISDWLDYWFEPLPQIMEWIKNDKIIIKEHVTEGFENVYDAFIGMLRGENTGKAIVKLNT